MAKYNDRFDAVLNAEHALKVERLTSCKHNIQRAQATFDRLIGGLSDDELVKFAVYRRKALARRS